MKRILKINLFACFLISAVIATARDYHIDSVNGNDSNDGLEGSPWQSLANINTTNFQPGDRILFKAGQSWTGTLKPNGSGTSANPITISGYGEGDPPQLNGAGMTNCTAASGDPHYCTIYLYNQEHWVIDGIEITNYNANEEGGISLEEWEQRNITDYAEVVSPEEYTGSNTLKSGILVEVATSGAIEGLLFLNLEIHGINGDISNKDNGGIFLEIYQGSGPSYFTDILVENCSFHDIDRTALSNWSYYDNREFTSNSNWTPNENYVIRNCQFMRSGANALIVRVSDGALIEQCLFEDCAIKGSGNAAFNFNTDNTLWQFNEFSRTKANPDDEDAGGVDSDYRSSNTTIQYNYLHDNDFGLLVTGGPGRWNDNTIIRYNIIENDGSIARKGNDGKFAIRYSGSATNVYFYNNVVYLPSSLTNAHVIYIKSWSGAKPDKSYFHNNIFYVQGTGASYNFGPATNNVFTHNVFFGLPAAGEPSDANKVESDPLLLNPGGGDIGYSLKDGSPAIAAGVRLENMPANDFYGNQIDPKAPIDIGIEQQSEAMVLGTPYSQGLVIYPNPIVGSWLKIGGALEVREISIYDIEGNRMKLKMDEKMCVIDVSGLSSGIYLLKILNENGGEMVTKFLKN